MIGLPAACQTHGYETCQGCGLKKASIWRLDFTQLSQGALASGISDGASERVSRGGMIMMSLPNRDQCWKGITDHRQSQGCKHRVWKCSQLEWKRNHMLPGIGAGAQPPSERAHGQDGHRKRPILSVSSDDSGGEAVRLGASDFLLQPPLGCRNGF